MAVRLAQLRAGHSRIRIPAEEKKSLQSGSAARSLLFKGTGGYCSWGWYGTLSTPPFSAEVKNRWRYASTLPIYLQSLVKVKAVPLHVRQAQRGGGNIAVTILDTPLEGN